MKNIWALALLLIQIALCESLLAAPADPLTNELDRLQGVYATALAAIEVKYQTLLTNVPTQYLQGLDMLEKAYQQKGEFKSVMAVRAERDKINRDLFAPGPDSETDPKELKDLRARTRSLPAQMPDQKAKEHEALTAAYYARLEALQRELTKTGRIPLAANVQVEIDKIQTNRDRNEPPINNATATIATNQSLVSNNNAEPSNNVTVKVASPPIDTEPRRIDVKLYRATPSSNSAVSRFPEVKRMTQVSPRTDFKKANATVEDDVTVPLGTEALAGTQTNEARKLLVNKPYLVVGEYVVPNGKSLELDPGVILKFSRGASISTSGTLLVNGTPDQPVQMIGSVTGIGLWKGIRLANSKGSVLQYVKITGAEVGIDIKVCKPRISNSLITQNTIGIRTQDRGTEPVIENCIITDNTSHGIQISFSSAIFNSCTIANNGGYGIRGNYYPNPLPSHSNDFRA